ncbi:acetobutylicum phosphotransbutyrylase,Predicted integral membrane protein,VanZ like family [[Clostridium] sordellii]|uniref:VanZ family protein n=1 Tax=Paraclostridium sordellii TaxID=1505 RepID=UPI0005441B71|nr:VanZ family protein [Paeniclostridium sordellii]CEK32861.1 acetobutylicum phosphotransbutyrylase,Predicted integral membrane protein,VanZ like family [[Clostridium] sordellii] [Paeniclostridium sordellii]
MKKFKNIWVGLTIIWMGLIYYMSNQPASISSSQSGGFINMLSNLPIIGNTIKELMKIGIAEFLIRKSAHMFLYFMLSILIYMVFKNINNKKAYLYSIIGCFIYACTDEIHQLFIIGRSGEFKDVLVDTLGATIGLLIVFIINKILNLRKNKIKS